MDDDIEVIYSTPLPGASSTPQPHHAAASSPPHVLLHSSPLPPPPPPPDKKPADYVYYERRPDDLSSDARARATAAKVKLQSHYRIALETAIDLNVRCAQRCFYSVFRLSIELLLLVLFFFEGCGARAIAGGRTCTGGPADAGDPETYANAKSVFEVASDEDRPAGFQDGQGDWEGCVWRGTHDRDRVVVVVRMLIVFVCGLPQVRLVQKIDTGRVYAMKTLQKAEMLKRDQVCFVCLLRGGSRWLIVRACSSHTSARSATSLQSQRRLGSCSCTIRFKILYICT